MKILSVNTGVPQEITFNGVTLKTSMVRTPQSKIKIEFKQVHGDEFFGKQIHGIPDCVVYALCAEKYIQWEKILNQKILPFNKYISCDLFKIFFSIYIIKLTIFNRNC